MDGRLFLLLLVQICVIERAPGVYCHLTSDLENLVETGGYLDSLRTTACCSYDKCDILCCFYKGVCHHFKKRKILNIIDGLQARFHLQKRATQSWTSMTALCYNASDHLDLRLWNNSAPGAVGNDSCKDIPFLRIFLPDGSVSRTDIGIVVIPGGGYNELTNVNEQTPVGQYFANQLGITTFVLYYRLVQETGIYRYPVPMWDGQSALRYVRYNAAQYSINPRHVGLFGFSAGGHLASTIALHSDHNFNLTVQDDIDSIDAQPVFLGLGYPVISMDPEQYASPSSLAHLLYGYTGDELTSLENFLSGQKNVNTNTTPTFLFESVDDAQISSQNSVLFVKALEDANVSYEAHIFEHGRHGVGLAENELAESIWPQLFHIWLAERNLTLYNPSLPSKGSAVKTSHLLHRNYFLFLTTLIILFLFLE